MNNDANKDAREAMLSGADKLEKWGQPSYAELIAETERGIAELKRHLSERGHWPTMQPARPAGWSFVANQDGSVIVQGPNGGCVVRQDATEARTIPEAVLWELAKDLASAPAPALAPMTDASRFAALVETSPGALCFMGVTYGTPDEFRAAIDAWIGGKA